MKGCVKKNFSVCVCGCGIGETSRKGRGHACIYDVQDRDEDMDDIEDLLSP